MLPLHLGVARITALIPLASWIALVAVIALIAPVTVFPLVALIALIAGLRLSQPQGCAGNTHQGEPADGSCNGVHGIPFCCHKRAPR